MTSLNKTFFPLQGLDPKTVHAPDAKQPAVIHFEGKPPFFIFYFFFLKWCVFQNISTVSLPEWLFILIYNDFPFALR